MHVRTYIKCQNSKKNDLTNCNYDMQLLIMSDVFDNRITRRNLDLLALHSTSWYNQLKAYCKQNSKLEHLRMANFQQAIISLKLI